MGAGLGSLLGGVASGALGLVGGLFQNSSNANEVAQQEAYQTQMSDTQYQRTVADMTAAGLNPMMMFTGGGGTDSSPMGSTMQMTNVLQSASNAAQSTGNQLSQLYQQQPLIDAQTTNAIQTEPLIRANAAKAADDETTARIRSENAAYTQSTTVNSANASNQAATDEAALNDANAKTDLKFQSFDQATARGQATADAAHSAASVIPIIGKTLGDSNRAPSPNSKYIDTRTTGTYDLSTGEVH